MGLSRRSFFASLGAMLAPAWSAAEPTRPLPGTMQARDASPGMDPHGWLVSEKLDGVRALWDGRQLRTRSGLPIAAPAWFTRGLPALALDGELWLGRGQFQAASGLVRRLQPDPDAWRALRYMVFDLPGATGPFSSRASRLRQIVLAAQSPSLVAVPQFELADAHALQQRLAAVLRAGGEGLMLHRADASWAPGRSDALRKLKPQQDADATVIGHLPGHGRHVGRLGALRVRADDGREFRLGTGFSDAERERPPALGQTVTYTYRGLTDRGLPRFASFLRVRGAE